MNTELPSIGEIQALLRPLHHRAMQLLARLSGVPFPTLWKIKDGTTRNPGVETVRRFLPHVAKAAEFQSAQGGETLNYARS